ncbi:hypothetical protein [Nostoc sp. DedQUE09]|uniref:hypothetical protein n=1 Tax=Nostoc sp. DedQUE09 TaxID=3075394 RepID=UPI002AD4CBFB|nr:hypothetical protein [Nostoc sp. DedQUE09]MDZ7955672.1 hypothetical protein [Nostoc sp. DedQUE09]
MPIIQSLIRHAQAGGLGEEAVNAYLNTFLKSVGFTGVNGQTVLLKGEFTKKIDGKENTSKQWRVEAVIATADIGSYIESMTAFESMKSIDAIAYPHHDHD